MSTAEEDLNQEKTFADQETALRMREAMERMMIKVLDQERPPYQYGTVTVINTDGRSCQVLLNGDTVAVKVAYGAMRPVAVGQVVRVSGNRGDRFISDVMGGAASSDPASEYLTVPTGLTLGGTYRGVIARWNPADGAFAYDVQFADNLAMSTNPRTYVTGSTQFSEEPLNAGQVVYARVRSKTSAAANSAFSNWSAVAGPINAVAMPVESVTDLAAPTTSPTAIVTSSLGFLMIEWLPVSNNDPLTYEVHISLTNGFTPAGAATKIGETSGTFFTAERNAAGAALVYGTTYYVRIIAKDKDGAAAAGGQGSGVMGQVGTGDVSKIDYSKLGDGVAPTSSPTPVVTNGVGYLYVTWTALSPTADGVVYEVHVSTVNGFTPSAATYVVGTPSDFTFIRKQGSGAGSAALVYGTLYYIKIIAKDVDGQAAASPQASGTPQKVTTVDIGDAAVGANQVGPGAITYDKTSLAIGGANLIPNSSFEGPPAGAGYVTPEGWTFVQGGTIVYDAGTTGAVAGASSHGAQYLRVRPSSGTWTNAAYFGYRSNFIPGFTAGQRIYASWHENISIGANLKLQFVIHWYTTAGAYVDESTFESLVGTSGWVRRSGTAVVPATATKCYVWLLARSTGTAVTGGDFQFDAVQLEISDFVTGYSPSVGELVSGSVGTTQIRDDAITTQKIAANQITAAKIAANTITAAEIAAAAITADKIAAGSITAEKLTIGTFGPTLNPNGGFEDVSPEDANLPSSWNLGTTAGSTSYGFNAAAADVKQGGKSFYMTFNTNGAGTSREIFSDKFTVEQSKRYAVEFYYKILNVTWGSGIYVNILWYNRAQTYLFASSLISNGGATSNVWTFFEGIVTAPSDGHFAVISISVVSPPANASIVWDAVKFSEQISATRIADGAITTDKIAANQITAAKIAADTITANEIAGNTIRAAEMVAGTITAASGIIADAAIGTAKIVDANITTAKIADLNVTTGKIALLGVDTAQIKDAAIANAKIGNLQVTTGKIDTMEATKLIAGTISAATIVLGSGGQFKVGSNPGAGTTGMYINDQGISIYNSSTRTIYLDATTGGGTITGATIQTAATGKRIVLGGGGALANDITFYSGSAQTENNPGSLNCDFINSGTATRGRLNMVSPRHHATNSQVFLQLEGPSASGILGAMRCSGASSFVFGSISALYSDVNATGGIGFTTRNSTISVGNTLSFNWDSNKGYSGYIDGTAVNKFYVPGTGGLYGDFGGYGGGLRTRDASSGHFNVGYDGNAQITLNINDQHFMTINRTTNQFALGTNTAKTFVIAHPTDEDRLLVHAVAEGPTSDVFYRGKGKLENGVRVVRLPEYFEALTCKEGRTVQLTPIGLSTLTALPILITSEVENGQFIVRGDVDAEFFWRVDAIRVTDPWDVEPLKKEVVVYGDGPYRYIK